MLLKDRVLLGILGLCLVVVGSVGAFVNASDMASTAAIVAGAVIAAVGLLIDRIPLIKYGDYEIHLAKDYFEAAEIADEEGDEPAAEALRGEGLGILRQAKESSITYSAAIDGFTLLRANTFRLPFGRHLRLRD
ncbi:MAG: hypothetical protein M3277_12430 [Actinomycetota bacterium]|nr:hypothetical protein [Actinomycetota bacterium]